MSGAVFFPVRPIGADQSASPLNVQRRHHDFRQLGPKIRGGERTVAVEMLADLALLDAHLTEAYLGFGAHPLPQEIGAGTGLDMSALSRAPDRI
jgi:hypothetical protein